MPRTHTPPASIEIGSRQAAEALASYTEWQVTGSPQDTPVLLGKLGVLVRTLPPGAI